MEVRKQKMVGVKYLVSPGLWPAAAPILKEEAVRDFARQGRLLPTTWNREVQETDEGVLVIYTADVMPHAEEDERASAERLKFYEKDGDTDGGQ